MKIAILGYSGSGKSTLARRLGDYYEIPTLFLDTVQFVPNWIERDRDEARAMTSAFMKQESWVIDGNYTGFYQRERLEQADQIIIFNFPRMTCLYRAFKRYFKNRNTTRADMAEGCIEKMDLPFIWWILHEGRTKEKRNHYKQIELEFKGKVVVLNNPKQLEQFLNQTIV